MSTSCSVFTPQHRVSVQEVKHSESLFRVWACHALHLKGRLTDRCHYQRHTHERGPKLNTMNLDKENATATWSCLLMYCPSIRKPAAVHHDKTARAHKRIKYSGKARQLGVYCTRIMRSSS